MSTFANQASAALDNASLYRTLEDRVDERTEALRTVNAELEDRAAELSIINGVQQGLSSNLEMQAIYNLVGNRIRDIFDAQVVHIRMYDAETDWMTFPFVLDRDERLDVPGVKVDGIGVSGEVIRTRKPILVNRDYRTWAEMARLLSARRAEGMAQIRIGLPDHRGRRCHGNRFGPEFRQ